MTTLKHIIFFVFFFLGFTACELLVPENDNHSTIERVYEDPSFAEGLLIRAYTLIPTNDYRWDEVATDDAVTNDPINAYLRIGTGEWSSIYNPQNLWDNSNRAILYINHFLDVVDEVPFKWTDDQLNALFVRRLTGESYALRGLFKYFLLRNHGGIGVDGNLLGIPEYNHFLESMDDFSLPRQSFEESVKSAMEDLDKAINYLPIDYHNIGSLDDLPDGFSLNDVPSTVAYNNVFGDIIQQRISGRHVKAIKSKLALLAASPAFNDVDSPGKWEEAATIAGELLVDIGGISGLDPQGHLFYLKEQVDRAELTSGDGTDLPEILWRRPITNNRSREQNNFPPSLYGNGRINPTQNLVDAFPMKNGFPIIDSKSGFDPADPYANRDPRLSQYILYNRSSFRGEEIVTEINSGEDGLDAMQNSTRTGYYLKKLMREDVNVNPSSPADQKHFNTHIRYTEIFLNYAEAANEAWGPDGGPFSFSAKDVIAAIRKRAGIDQPDEFLQSINDKESMKELIRNERRLELCFESFRFWDLRRWKEDLTVPARGVQISMGEFSYFDVEPRIYNNDYMHYGPIPYNEVLKFNLVQNQGWN